MRLILPLGYAHADREARAAIRLGAMRDYGWQCTVYSPGIAAVDSTLSAAGMDVRHLPMRGLTDYVSISSMASHLRDELPDACVLTQSYRAAFIALCARKLAGRKDLRVALLYRSRTAPRTSWLARRIFRNLSAVLFTSTLSKTLFRTTEQRLGFPLTPPERQHFVVEGAGEQPAPAPEPKGPVMALYNGELRHGCGLGRIIDRLPALKGQRIRLLVAGQGTPDYMDRLRRRAIRSGAMDLISWRRDRISLPEIADRCHFGIFPYKDERGFSDANVEVMAAGRPQIVADTLVAREYLQDDGGSLFIDPLNPEAFIDAMKQLGADADLRIRLGREAACRYDAVLSPERTLPRLAAILG